MGTSQNIMRALYITVTEIKYQLIVNYLTQGQDMGVTHVEEDN